MNRMNPKSNKNDTLGSSTIGNRSAFSSSLRQTRKTNSNKTTADAENNHATAITAPTRKWIVLEQSTQQVVDNLLHDSILFTQNPKRPMAQYKPSEIELGPKMLGEGEFSVVYPIVGFDFCQDAATMSADQLLVLNGGDPSSVSSSKTDTDDGNQQQQLRKHLAIHVMMCGDGYDGPRYAIKQLKRNKTKTATAGEVENDAMVAGVIDMACEAHFLSTIQHTNIVKLRGRVGELGTPDFGLILDCLQETLDTRIAKWKTEKREIQRLYGMFGLGGCFLCGRSGGQEQKEDYENLKRLLLQSQLLAAYDIARAMAYLRQNKILHRDLKPENIGVDVHGEVKVFDFGLAKELKAHDLVNAPDFYKATGMTGTRRYMAVECARCQPYGFSADIYSFSILLWQMLALQIPFELYNQQQHYDLVVMKGMRPPTGKGWIPDPWSKVLCAGWNDDPQKRPTFEDMCSILQEELKKLDNSNDMDRSRHLLEKSLRSYAEKYTSSEL